MLTVIHHHSHPLAHTRLTLPCSDTLHFFKIQNWYPVVKGQFCKICTCYSRCRHLRVKDSNFIFQDYFDVVIPIILFNTRISWMEEFQGVIHVFLLYNSSFCPPSRNLSAHFYRIREGGDSERPHSSFENR